MASQLVSTSGNKRLRRNQIAELEARMGSLKEIEAQKAINEMHDERMAFENKQFNQNKKMAKKTLSLQSEISKRTMGVAAANFGMNIATSKNATISQIGNRFGIGGGTRTTPSSPRFGGLKTAGAQTNQPGVGSTVPGASKAPGSFFGNLQPGQLLGSGLAGFGASRMVKGKGKRMLLGAGVGGLMSLFGGAGGYGAAGGAMFGGLAGLI